VLAFYRAMLGLRREAEALRTGRTRFFNVEEPVLAFTRGGTVLCVFNLSPERREVALKGGGAVALAEGAEQAGRRLVLHANGFAIMAATGRTAVADLPPAKGRRGPVSAGRASPGP
jgi:alpha-glucosidase